MPNGSEFLKAAKEIFSFMPDALKTEETTTFYSASFKSRLIAVSVSYDIRDGIVSCTLNELRDISNNNKKIALPIYCHLHGYLVEERGYRGSFKEFKVTDEKNNEWKNDLKKYAMAVQHFFPKEVEG